MKAIISVDSLSVLNAACSVTSNPNKSTQFVQAKAQQELAGGNDINICWIPSHVGIAGKEAADRPASFSQDLLP